MRYLLFAASFVIAGCSAMSESDCRNTNWSDLGEREALIYGQRPQIDLYAYQCSKYGVQPSEPQYMAGWVYGQGERIRRSAGEGCCSPR